MAQTGMETLEIIKGVLDETSPDYIIAIDALAARSTKRLNRTIQITDTGISPGSGVGNHRHALNKESMGIPVVAIGIPTVVDAVTIVSDTMNSLVMAMEETRRLEDLGRSISRLEQAEKYYKQYGIHSDGGFYQESPYKNYKPEHLTKVIARLRKEEPCMT